VHACCSHRSYLFIFRVHLLSETLCLLEQLLHLFLVLFLLRHHVTHHSLQWARW
jgi:hypothetical protein